MMIFFILLALISSPALSQEAGQIDMTTPLTSEAGDIKRGMSVALDSTRGNCAICHSFPVPDFPVFGNMGPDLSGIGSRRSVAEIRRQIIDPKQDNPGTLMPAYFKIDGLVNVAKAFEGKTLLSAQDVEDLIAYLESLR